MFPVRAPSAPPQNPLSLSGSDRTASPAQERPSSQPVAVPLPPSVTVGDLIFQTGRVMTALSDAEVRILCVALHAQTPKEPLLNDNNLLTYAIGAKDYFSPRHLPPDLPERMLVTCALDPSLNLERVMIADLNQRVYCDARIEPYATAAQTLAEHGSLPITAAAASRPGSTEGPAFSPPAPPEAASPYASLNARAQFSAAARGGSFASAAPFSNAPEARATKKKAPPASDAQLRAALREGDRLRSEAEVMAALQARGVGAGPTRITPLLRAAKEMQQSAATGSQAREE